MKLFKIISKVLVAYVILFFVIGFIVYGLLYLCTECLGVDEGLQTFSFSIAGTGISSLLIVPKFIDQLVKYDEKKKNQGYRGKRTKKVQVEDNKVIFGIRCPTCSNIVCSSTNKFYCHNCGETLD